MAVVNASRTELAHGAVLFVWANMADGDTGQPVEAAGHVNKTAQIAGTFGVGGTCVVQGSNNGTTYDSMTDPQGNAISKTAAATEIVAESTRYIRPNITAGDVTTSITVSMLMQRAR